MLHIVTPLYRFNFLQDLWYSIPMNEDIIWHISKSNKREDLTYEFLKSDKRIKLYNIDCEDNETYKKRNIILEKLTKGYFCFLDDDTTFHENMYIKYLECVENNFNGMIIGQQIGCDGEIRLTAVPPKHSFIDTGNVISHTSCLTKCKWPETYIPGENQRDFLFWDSVYNYYGKKCGIWNQPISFYNKLSK